MSIHKSTLIMLPYVGSLKSENENQVSFSESNFVRFVLFDFNLMVGFAMNFHFDLLGCQQRSCSTTSPRNNAAERNGTRFCALHRG